MSAMIIKSREANDLKLTAYHGHFATRHSHNSHYLDITRMKHECAMADIAAASLANHYVYEKEIDTVVCLDGSEVIGACMASELTKAGYTNMNAHQTIYVVTPEHTTGSQLLFRENTAPMIAGKHVLVLAASVTTGFTVQGAVEAIRYYGGDPVGIASIFASVKECAGYPVASIFDTHDLPDYETYDSHSCPWCRQGKKIDALVNSFGYSSL